MIRRVIRGRLHNPRVGPDSHFNCCISHGWTVTDLRQVRRFKGGLNNALHTANASRKYTGDVHVARQGC
jgi:hypothetical protein